MHEHTVNEGVLKNINTPIFSIIKVNGNRGFSLSKRRIKVV